MMAGIYEDLSRDYHPKEAVHGESNKQNRGDGRFCTPCPTTLVGMLSSSFFLDKVSRRDGAEVSGAWKTSVLDS